MAFAVLFQTEGVFNSLGVTKQDAGVIIFTMLAITLTGVSVMGLRTVLHYR